ncbi:MAG: sugar-binding domain-containing protein, partial [Pseudothermotoga sp.]
MRVNLDHNWKLRYEDGVVRDNISLPHQFPITEQSYPNPLCFSGVYERKLPELNGLSKKHVLLRFHGIDFFSKVYVNQKLVSIHENGYDLFETQIDGYLNFDGQDLLQIFVSDLDITKNPHTVMG